MLTALQPLSTGLWALGFCAFFDVVHGVTLSPDELASSMRLTTSTSFPFPQQTLVSSDTQTEILENWSLAKAKIQEGGPDLAFVDDPFPTSSAPVEGPAASGDGPVLQVTYPEGSFSIETGGSQFINLWNGTNFQTMMITYEVAFDEGFDWVKGGKLPGIRGGDATTGCSGGHQPTGSDCFSVRVMWRRDALAEAYAYLPTPNNLCEDRSIRCNDDFGVSISRGSFVFTPGGWNRITLLVQLNDPPNIANGQVQLFYNDASVLIQQNLQLRASTSLLASGMYFSTFFGGSDESWATPQTTHTYFRNISLWGSSEASTLEGEEVVSSAQARQPSTFLGIFIVFVCLASVIPL